MVFGVDDALVAGGAAVGNIVGGLVGAGGSRYATDQSVALAHDMAGFQANMANTAHQREAADLEAAGINRILTAGGGGAATASGMSASIENPGEHIGRGISGAASSAVDALAKKSAIENTEADTKLKAEQSDTQEKQQELLGEQIRDQRASATASEKQLPALVEKAKAEASPIMQKVRAWGNTFGGILGDINSGVSIFRALSPSSSVKETYNGKGEMIRHESSTRK
jgi:hypothetical protein